jgi:hypothetical protein
MVTHRYQDGNLMANFRYNSKQGVGAGQPRGWPPLPREPLSWCCAKAG